MEGDMIKDLFAEAIDAIIPMASDTSVIITWAGVALKFVPLAASVYIQYEGIKAVANKLGHKVGIRELGGLAVSTTKAAVFKFKDSLMIPGVTEFKGKNSKQPNSNEETSLIAEAKDTSRILPSEVVAAESEDNVVNVSDKENVLNVLNDKDLPTNDIRELLKEK